MTDYIKEPHTIIFTGSTKCGKTHFVLDFIEKEYNKHFDYIVIICPTVLDTKTHHIILGTGLRIMIGFGL